MVEQWKVKCKRFQGTIEKMMKANLFQRISFTFQERYQNYGDQGLLKMEACHENENCNVS